jgi:hypothetical protein
MEARVGFEPTNGGFADLSLGPLGYRAELLSIAKLAQALGVAASSQKLPTPDMEAYQELCALGLRQKESKGPLAGSQLFLFIISCLPGVNRSLFHAGNEPIPPVAWG